MWEVLYNILIEFGMPRKLVQPVKMCWNEIYGTVCMSKNLSDRFPIQNDLKGDVLSLFLFGFALEYAIRWV
jgi:hypothetical protein